MKVEILFLSAGITLTIVLGFILIPIVRKAIAEDAKPPTNQDNRTKID